MATGEKSEAETSLRDDLAAGLKAIEERESAEAASVPNDEGSQPAQAEADAEASETQADRGDGRDAHGRFVKKNEGEATDDGGAADTQPSAKPEEANQGAETKAPEQPQDAQTPDAAPTSWRSDEAKVWAQLPPEAKSAIHRREMDNKRLAGANDAERMFGREMADLWRPHVAEIQAQGATPQLALKALLANHNDLRSADPAKKFGTARRLLMEYGIDPAQLAQPDPNAPSDPFVLRLQNEIAQLKSRLGQPQGQQFAPLPPSADENNIMAEIEAFRADPAHPHFDAVTNHMGQLLETGAAPDLESAYHAAVAMNPALRSTAAPAEPQRTQEDKTAAARRASASVTGSPGQSGSPRPMSLRDELAEGLRSAGFPV
jgi:hypothetical protein